MASSRSSQKNIGLSLTWNQVGRDNQIYLWTLDQNGQLSLHYQLFILSDVVSISPDRQHLYTAGELIADLGALSDLLISLVSEVDDFLYANLVVTSKGPPFSPNLVHFSTRVDAFSKFVCANKKGYSRSEGLYHWIVLNTLFWKFAQKPNRCSLVGQCMGNCQGNRSSEYLAHSRAAVNSIGFTASRSQSLSISSSY